MSCAYCKRLKRLEWLGRIGAEAFMADHVRFVTLTYNDDHVKSGLSLPNHHFKSYLQARRKKYDFLHFTVGEFGEKKGRPHWHSLQFFYGEMPTDILDLSHRTFGWRRGNAQYERVRSIAGSASYVYDYLDKGGKALRPSPGIGKTYLQRHVRSLARNRRLLCHGAGIRYTVPGVVKPKGGHWTYYFPNSHQWSVGLAEDYIEEWLATHDDDPPYENLKGISYG